MQQCVHGGKVWRSGSPRAGHLVQSGPPSDGKFRRVWRLISFTCLSADPFGPVLVLISHPLKNHDESQRLPCKTICLKGRDGANAAAFSSASVALRRQRVRVRRCARFFLTFNPFRARNSQIEMCSIDTPFFTQGGPDPVSVISRLTNTSSRN